MVRRDALHRREDHVACSVGRILLGTSFKCCLKALCLALSLFGEAREHLGSGSFGIQPSNFCKARIHVGTGHIEGNRFINKGALALCDGDLSASKEALTFGKSDFPKAEAFSFRCRSLAVGLLGQLGFGTQACNLALCCDDKGALLLARLFEDGGGLAVRGANRGSCNHASQQEPSRYAE
jgi:hypothetical protein